MAYTQTRAEIRTLMEQIGDIENDGHISTAEKDNAINRAYAEFRDLCIKAGQQEHFVKSVTFNTVAGQQEYPFATLVAGGDFMAVHGLFVNEGGNQFRPVNRIQPTEVQSFRPPTTVVPMKLYYLPVAPKIATGGGNDSTTLECLNGYGAEYIAICALTIVKFKKEDDYNQLWRRKKELEEMIYSMANTDWSGPARIARRKRHQYDPFLLYQNNINAYMIRGDNLELFYHYGYIV